MTLQFTLQFCIGRIMVFCQAIKIAEYFSVIKPFEGFGSKKTPRPYANNSVGQSSEIEIVPLPSPGFRQLHLLQVFRRYMYFKEKLRLYNHLIFSRCSLLLHALPLFY